jgi:hypothetical protein
MVKAFQTQNQRPWQIPKILPGAGGYGKKPGFRPQNEGRMRTGGGSSLRYERFLRTVERTMDSSRPVKQGGTSQRFEVLRYASNGSSDDCFVVLDFVEGFEADDHCVYAAEV